MSRKCLIIAALLVVADAHVRAADFRTEVLPVLEEKCVRCHGARKPRGMVRLDNLPSDLVKEPVGAETWHDALNAISRGDMPPEGEPGLSREERRMVTGWIRAELERLAESRRGQSGQVTLRRLNRIEYQNVMTDLLGVELNYTRDLPPDPVSPDGFQNNAASLQMSALQLEYYLAAARRGLSSALVEGPEPNVHEHSATETVKDKGKGNWTSRLGRSGQFVARVKEFPDTGEFEIRVRARAEVPEGGAWPVIQVRLGFRADVSAPSKTVAVADINSTETEEYVFRGRLEEFPIQSRTQSKYPGMLIWVDNVYDDGESAPLSTKRQKKAPAKEDPEFPKIIIEQVSFRAPVFSSWPPASHRQIVAENPKSVEQEGATASNAIRTFLRRAWRRPVSDEEVAQADALYQTIRPSSESFEHALRETLAMVLVSPDFLYVTEPDGQYDQFHIATRLALFLWATMPDAELTDLAANGSLADSETLQSQVERMLADPRSARFVHQFVDQWLNLDGLDRVAVNPEVYPAFNNALKLLMRQETREYFGWILREDASALDLLKSDYTMLNDGLARHYGISGPRGSRFERVVLQADGERPGGLLGHGSILLSNSDGENSHPIRRAVWIRDRLLDDPPAPPPPDVPDLNQDLPEIAALPLRDQLELHLENDACADCHRGIDPWGVALEEFDAIGLYRTTVRTRASAAKRPPKGRREEIEEHPVDARTVLPDGTNVAGLRGLSEYLVKTRKEQFARTLVVKLLTYALGRSLEFSDEQEVDRLTKVFSASGFRIRELIKEIALSSSFLRSSGSQQ